MRWIGIITAWVLGITVVLGGADASAQTISPYGATNAASSDRVSVYGGGNSSSTQQAFSAAVPPQQLPNRNGQPLFGPGTPAPMSPPMPAVPTGRQTSAGCEVPAAPSWTVPASAPSGVVQAGGWQADQPLPCPPSDARMIRPASYQADTTQANPPSDGLASMSQAPPLSPQATANDGRDSAAIELPLPTERQSSLPPLKRPGGAGQGRSTTGVTSMTTVAGSLAVVLGLFFLVVWTMRRATPKAMQPLPSAVFEVLGRAPMAGRQQAHLIRCGCKLLLVNVTPDGAETLTEITDPMEVDRLAGLCRQSVSGSSTQAFRQVFQQFATEPQPAEATGQAESGLSSLPGASLFGRHAAMEERHG